MTFVVPIKGEYKNYTLSEIKKTVDPIFKSSIIGEINEYEQKLETTFSETKKSTLRNKEQQKQYRSIQKVNRPINRARDIMTRKVLTIAQTTSLIEIQKEMKKNNIHHLPVIGDGNLLIGMVSDRDLFKFLDPQKKAVEIMSSPLIIALDSTPIKEIAQLFIVENISAVPVIDNFEKFVGIITHRDILKCLMNKSILNNCI